MEGCRVLKPEEREAYRKKYAYFYHQIHKERYNTQERERYGSDPEYRERHRRKCRRYTKEMTKRRREEYEANPNLCRECNAPIPYAKMGRRRVYCSPRCSSKYRSRKKWEEKKRSRSPRPPRFCEVCGSRIVNRSRNAKYCMECSAKCRPKRKKRRVPKKYHKLRFRVFARDNFTCQYCGKKAPKVELRLDHIVPISKGGTYTLKNLLTSCVECNSGKGDMIVPQLVRIDQYISE